jgi:predicted porin
MKEPKMKALSFAISGICLAVAMPAFAETEIESLKREVAEQKRLIQSILAAQESQKKINSKMEAQTSDAKNVAVSSGPGAQGVTLYGVADVNVSSMNSGQGRKVSLGSSGLSGSRLGVKGERDVGGGMKVVGLAEAGIAFDTGGVGNGATTLGLNNTTSSSGGLTGTGVQLFSRQIYAGLASNLGSLTIGRQYSGSYLAASTTGTAMGPGFYGSSVGWLPIIGGMPTRANNSVVYGTPKLNGFSGRVTYTVGSENNVSTNTAVGATTTNDKAGEGADLALMYANGPLDTALTTWNVNNTSFVTAGETGLAKRKGWQFAAKYDFGFVKLYGTVVSGTISGGNYESVTKTLSKALGSSVSASIPFGKSTVFISYTNFDDKSLLNKDGKLIGLSYTYDLYTNTKLYASWGKLANNSNSTYSLTDGGNLVGNVTTAGFSPTGLMGGLNYSF